MIKEIFAVRDIKGNFYDFPHFDITIGQAIRHFGDLVRNQKSPFYAHPEDYSLYHIGNFNQKIGQVSGFDAPVFLSNAIEHVAASMPQKNGASGIEEVPHHVG